MSQDKPLPLDSDISDFRIAIVAARFNQRFVDALLQAAYDTLKARGLSEDSIQIYRVPGALEVPYAAHMAAETMEYDAIIALGVVIAGDTNHHEHIAHSTAHALLRTSQDTQTPVLNGIITVETEQQAEDRCGSNMNRGEEFACAALEMATLRLEFEDSFDDLLDDVDDEYEAFDKFEVVDDEEE